MRLNRMWLQVGVMSLLLVTGCVDSGTKQAAPLGERQSLQQLADAYERVRQDMPVNPSGLLPMGKRKFVERVFAAAGFDYSATLLQLATVKSEQLTPYHKDMKELLYMPHTGSKPADMGEVYSADELSAIAAIDGHFSQAP